MKGFIVVFLISLILTWMASQVRQSKSIETIDGSRFRAVRTVYVAYVFVLILSLFLCFSTVHNREERRTTWIIGCSLGGFAILTWPKTIYLRPSGVFQQSWYGGWKSMTWKAIIKVKKRRDGSIAVTDGSRIIALSQYYAGHDSFLEQMEKQGKHPVT
jgi:hypothetical protein